MEKYSNYEDTITGLQNEVSKYSFNNNMNNDMIDQSTVQNNETNFISSIPKIDFNKLMFAFPILLFALLVYFKPDFIMIDKPYDKQGKKINYSKVVITVTCITFLVYFVKCSFE